MEQTRIQSAFYIGLITVVLALNFMIFRQYFGVLLVALTLAVVFDPVYRRIKRLVKRDGLAAVLTTLLAFLIVLLPITYFSQQIFFELRSFYSSIQNESSTPFISTIVNKAQNSFGGFNNSFSIDFTQYLKNFASSVLNNLGGIFSSIAHLVFLFILVLMTLFFFLRDGERLKSWLYMISPFSDDVDKQVIGKLKVAINSVIVGQITVAIVQGLLSMLGFSIFGIPNPVLWGTVTILAALVPNFGTALVMIPAVAYLYFTANLWAAVGLGIWALTAVGLIDNVLGPTLINRGIKIHPFLVLLSVLGAISAFGPIGFLFGPLMLTLLFALFEIRSLVMKK